jgi:hypothetical protein
MFEKAFSFVNRDWRKSQTLKLVFLFIPELVVFIFGVILLPFLEVLFLPFIGNRRILTGRIGCTAGVWIDLYGSGTTITLIQKNTVCVMTLNTGHSFLLV